MKKLLALLLSILLLTGVMTPAFAADDAHQLTRRELLAETAETILSLTSSIVRGFLTQLLALASHPSAAAWEDFQAYLAGDIFMHGMLREAILNFISLLFGQEVIFKFWT